MNARHSKPLFTVTSIPTWCISGTLKVECRRVANRYRILSEYEFGVMEPGARDRTSYSWQRTVQAKRLSELLAALSQKTIPPMPEFSMGCDGFHRELAFGGYEGGVTYRWWVEPPVGWEILGELAREALRLANSEGALRRFSKVR